jgi:hypothetical protein
MLGEARFSIETRPHSWTKDNASTAMSQSRRDQCDARLTLRGWPEGRIKIARMTLTIKLDGNWSSFQLANSAPPLSVTDSAIAPSARMVGINYFVMGCGA